MKDILQDIHQYNHQFTISQVVTFFERKGRKITKSMIQNYVRDGLLPPPINKRRYTHKHLATLALIDALKNVYEMTHIKSVLLPLMEEDGIPLEVYWDCIQKTQTLPLHENVDSLALMAHSVDLKESVLLR